MASPQEDLLDGLLDELQRESIARQEALRDIAAQLPAATSRRAMVRAMVHSVATAPDKPTVARRVALKILRAPSDLWRRVRHG